MKASAGSSDRWADARRVRNRAPGSLDARNMGNERRLSPVMQERHLRLTRSLAKSSRRSGPGNTCRARSASKGRARRSRAHTGFGRVMISTSRAAKAPTAWTAHGVERSVSQSAPMARKHLFMSAKWLEVTRPLSLEERGLLVDLVLTAALWELPTLPLNVEVILAMARDEDEGACILERFAELCRLELVREVSPGLFEIAPGLWRLEESDWKGEA